MEPSKSQGNCWKCGTTLTPLDYGRQDTCDKCGAHTRVCKNCIHHDRSYNNECRENQAERVLDKERGNFCDYFKPKTGGGSGAPTKDELRAKAEALFGKKS